MRAGTVTRRHRARQSHRCQSATAARFPTSRRGERILRRMKRTRARPLALAITSLVLVACGSMPKREQPLGAVVPITAPVLAPGVDGNSDKLFVVLTFSGGGKRAAAFSYGVLEALRDVPVTRPDGEVHPLLDEIDLISAVSGGAFTAAYYALQDRKSVV